MEIIVQNIDVTEVTADLLVLKHADGFHGADRVVADAIGLSETLASGESRWLPGKGIAAREVLFIGVGRLHEFRYEQIQQFASAAIIAAQQHRPTVGHLALTIHGPGYGLDVEQSFLSLLAGVVAGHTGDGSALQKVTVVDRSEKRCELLNRLLVEAGNRFGLSVDRKQHIVTLAEADHQKDVRSNVVYFGARAETKARLFVAMPFADAYSDEFEIGFCEAARSNEFVCERLDVEAFVGDIFAEIRKRIVESQGVIALLNDHNPNVFLEIGYALANNQPTMLVAREDCKIPFDISGQRCIRYRSIAQLRDLMQREIAALKAQGVLRLKG